MYLLHLGSSTECIVVGKSRIMSIQRMGGGLWRPTARCVFMLFVNLKTIVKTGVHHGGVSHLRRRRQAEAQDSAAARVNEVLLRIRLWA